MFKLFFLLIFIIHGLAFTEVRPPWQLFGHELWRYESGMIAELEYLLKNRMPEKKLFGIFPLTYSTTPGSI
jgi:hypothetical protein